MREVLAYKRDHGGKMPSQYDPASSGLYKRFKKVRAERALAAAAQALLDTICAAKVATPSKEKLTAIRCRVKSRGATWATTPVRALKPPGRPGSR